jgi:hypothetical protein
MPGMMDMLNGEEKRNGKKTQVDLVVAALVLEGGESG